jgi:Glycosyl transferase family 2
MTGLPGLSIVVICRDEADYIDGCLAAIGQAADRVALPVEALVVDGASRDDTVRRAAAWSTRSGHRMGVRVMRCPRAGYGYQRNAGVAAARHPWVAFVSADVRVGPDWLAEATGLLDQPVDLVLGRFDLLTPPGRRPWLAALAATLYPTCGDEVVARCSTVHLFARRAALLRTPFDETLPACEDKDLAYRLQRTGGWQGARALRHRPAHLAREGVGAFLGKVATEARALGTLDRRTGGAFPDCFGWRRGARRLAGATVLAALACAARPRSRVVPAVAAAAVLAVGGRHAVGWRRRDPALPLAPQAALHATAMLAVSAGYFRGWLGAGGKNAPGQGLFDTGADPGGEPRGNPDVPIP